MKAVKDVCFNMDIRVYLDVISLVEKLHRLFLEVLKKYIERNKLFDITNTQLLLLHNIGLKDESIASITSSKYYMSSNLAYNIRTLVANEYIIFDNTTLKLSDKGKKEYHNLLDYLAHHKISNNLSECAVTLVSIEDHWNQCIK